MKRSAGNRTSGTTNQVLDAWLARNDLSWTDLAVRLGVNQATLWRIRNRRRPDQRTLLALSAITGLSVEELLGLPRASNPPQHNSTDALEQLRVSLVRLGNELARLGSSQAKTA